MFPKHHVQLTSVITAIALVPLAHAGSIAYVDDDAPPNGDGTSWPTAYRLLQDALADASGGGVSEIRVGQGVYRPDRSEANPDGSGSRVAAFELRNGVSLLGGYAGFGEADPDERDPGLYPAVLSGDLVGNDGSDFFLNGENSYHVLVGSGTDETAILDGFTISGGNANGAGFPQLAASGAGLLNSSGSPTIRSCRFVANFANEGGAGVGNFDDSHPDIDDCEFVGNTVLAGGISFGGGVTNVFGAAPTISGCIFTGNSAAAGGGIGNHGGSPTVVNSLFTANTANTGGAVHDFSGGGSDLVNCTLVGNIAEVGGGASASASAMSFHNSIVWGNTPDALVGSLMAKFSNIEGGFTGLGNIDADPTFADQAGGDYRLGIGSPCIDAGFNSVVPAWVAIDMLGNPRFLDDPDTPDTGLGSSPLVDMGMHEYSSCPDTDGNGIVDVDDLLNVILDWDGDGSANGGDVNGSGLVDVDDLTAVILAWGPCE